MRPSKQSNNPAGNALFLGAGRGAFSLVEILIAVTISVGVVVTAAIAFSAASKAHTQSYGTITLADGPTPYVNTYQVLQGENATQVEAFFAPHYGRVTAAERMRDSFLEDVRSATAVFCLSRAGRSTIRPRTITATGDRDARNISTPAAFRDFLIECGVPNAGTVFANPSDRGPAPQQNLSIFIMGTSSSATTYTVRAVYEVDFVSATSSSGRTGTFASVRRYDDYRIGKLGPTDFYDVFYPTPQGAAADHTAGFLPTSVFFEKAARAMPNEGAPTQLFKAAANRPFYFFWWPDPSSPYLETVPTSTTYPTSDPRYYYQEMANRTSFFMVVPMFPPL